MSATEDYPLGLSSALSLLAAVAAVALVADAPTQLQGLAAGVAGVVLVVVGLRLARVFHPVLGVPVVGLGTATYAAGFVLGRSGTLALELEIYLGLVGLYLLALGLGPLLSGWERWFVTAGSGGVLAAVVTSGVVQGAGTTTLLLAGAASVVAWDFGEQAINVSEQVGNAARTWPVELTHGTVGLVVGAFAVALAMVVSAPNITGVPLVGLSVLLGATVVLSTALYH